MLIKVLAMLAVFLICPFAYGEKIYKWTDENGQVHYGSSVPESNKTTARKIDPDNSKLTDAQRRDAEYRRAREKALARQRHNPDYSTTDSGSGDSGQADQDISSASMKKSNCAELWKRYQESMDCAARYKNVGGGIKGDVASNCPIMSQPALCD